MSKIVCKKWKKSFAQRFQAFEEIRIDDKFCDISLKSVDDVNVNAHKLVLVTGSGYFKDLFFSKMKESSVKCIDYNFIKLKGDVLEKVISFIYTGEVIIESSEKIEEIALCANYFQLDELIDECIKLLYALLDDNNCLKYWRLSHECFNKEFEGQCISHVLNSAGRIYENESFFNELHKDEMERLITDFRLPWSEEIKFEKVLQWMIKNTNTKEEFKETFSKFMEFINFTSLGPNIFGILADNHLIDDKEILEIITIKCKKVQCSLPSTISPEKHIFALIDQELMTISNDGNFIQMQQRQDTSIGAADTTFNNFLFICGGKNRKCDEVVNTCEYFDPVKKEWNALPSMLTSRADHACTFLDDKIYLCGGWCKYELLSVVEIFDVNQQKWMRGENMKTVRRNFGLTSANRALYAVGGNDDKSIEMFDPRSSSGWTEVYNESNFDDEGDENVEEYVEVEEDEDGYEYGYLSSTRCVSIDSDIHCFQLNDGETAIFDTKMNKMRYLKRSSKISNEFKLCFSNGFFNCIQKNSRNEKYLDFQKFDLEGNQFYLNKKALQFNEKPYINAIVALHF